jgi:hypothetical protein
MIRRLLALLVLAGGVGLAACGGSSGPSATNAAQVASGSGSGATTSSTSASSTSADAGGKTSTAGARAKAASHGAVVKTSTTGRVRTSSHTATTSSPAGGTTSTSVTHTTTSAAKHKKPPGNRPKPPTKTTSRGTAPGRTSLPKPAPVSVPNDGIPPEAQVSGPTPTACLSQAGLLDAHATQVETWQAVDATNKAPVYVDGPYTNSDQAKASAQSLQGVEMAVDGGLYVVTATLHSNLDFQVNAVAQCLSQVSGQGVLTF